jgi:hypothetical protein
MRQYRYAFEEDAANIRIRKKMIATEYNIGMRYIRHHEYERAIHCMQQVLQADPANERAKQKAAQLEDFLRRKAAGARDESPPSAD